MKLSTCEVVDLHYGVHTVYDYLIVGAGLFGATFARHAMDRGKKVIVVEARAHVGGNCHTYELEGVRVHAYGPHAFHTSDRGVWSFVNRFARFNQYEHRVRTMAKERSFTLPLSMRTFHEFWGVKTFEEAEARMAATRVPHAIPWSVEEWALANVGREVYELLFKGYTEKQWGRSADSLPSSIIRRLPVRTDWDDRYHGDEFQGVPEDGYTAMVERMLEGAVVLTSMPFDKPGMEGVAEKTVYTGPVDAFFGHRLGRLEYRTLDFRTEVLPVRDFQGIAQVNYADADVPWTRTVEHRHFVGEGPSDRTVVTWETPSEWKDGSVPYYPVNDESNSTLYARYKELTLQEPSTLFGGRLGTYRYFNMDQTVASAMALARREGLA